MKHLLMVAAPLLLGHTLWSDPVAPTYLKMVVTDNAGHGGTCQISRLAFFDATNGCVSVDLTQKDAGLAATELDENSFSPHLDYDGYDKPVSRIFNVDDRKWCFDWTDHVKESAITLTMRLDDTAQPVAYNFRSGGDDASYPDRALSSWVLYGSADGVNWDVCDVVKNLPAVKSNNAWYNGTIAEGANKGNFPIALLTNEARGALTFKCGSLPGRAVPQVTLNAYGVGANSASVVLDWSKTGDFTDSITTDPVAIEGEPSLGVPVALSVPDGLEAGATYQVRARVTNAKNVEATFGPVSTTLAAPDVSGYLMRADFKVDYDADDEAMDDFRVLVRLAERQPSGFTYEQCAADGSDLIFTSADGKSAYFFDVDTWNPLGESCVWVRLPRAKKGDTFSMYYGKAGATARADRENTWDGYVGVWHFAEASGTSYDATANNLDGEPKTAGSGNLDEMVGTDGVIGLARMNGTANGSGRNRTAVPPYDTLMTGTSFTISGWFRANDVSGYPRLWSSKTGYQSDQGFEMELSNNSKTTASARGASQNAITVTFPDISQDWLHLTLVYDNTTLTAYVNGEQNNSGTITAVGPTSEPLSFGSNAPGTEACFNGKYDEIRLVEGAQSAKRIAAEYANMATDDFLSCTGVVSTDSDMPNLESAAVAWEDDATTVSLVLKAGVGDASIVFTDVLSGQVYTIELAKGLDAREEVKTVSYPLTAEQLPPDATYSWVVTVANGKFDLPAKFVGESKYYSGAADPTVRYVSKTGSDENNGMLLSSAKATLQAAIDALGAEGGTVYVDDGDYAFTSDSDAAVTITTAVHVVGLSHDASKVTFTRTGTPKRNFLLNHDGCSLEFATISGGTMQDERGVSISLRKGTVADCVICNADGQDWRCHAALYADGDTRVARCIFRDNKGWFNGVALKAEGNAVIENCLFYNNINNGGGTNGGGTVLLGGWSSLINCTIAGNSGKESTGVCVSQYGNAGVLNCAIFGNTATSNPGTGHIWWGKKAGFYGCASETAINDSCFALAPGFRDAQNNDYTLSSASELIDAGLAYSGTVATSETDLAGNAREVDNVDIGCYEYAKTGFDIGFTASESEGLLPLSVTFAATVAGASGSLSYEWDFDNDGTVDETTDTATVTHVYTTAGLVSIGLTVKSDGGESRHAELLDAILLSPKTVYVDVNNGDNAVHPYDTLETATPDLATAILTAGNGSTVYVADGTYVAETVNGFALDKNVRLLSISGKPEDCVIKEASVTSERRVLTINHGSAVVAGLTLEGGSLNTSPGATLSFGSLGGLVSNCVIRAGYVRDWGGDAALAQVTANARVTHSILEQGLARDDYTTKNNRGRISSVYVAGMVDNCLIRDFNRGADNQNVVTVYNGGKLLNCTIVDGLCGSANDAEKTPCYGVRAEKGARVENCAIVGFRHVEDDESVTVRAWTGEAEAFASCATDTAEPINGTCVTVTTAAFRDYTAKDYRPTSGSPLIGKGKKNELADGTDLVGNRRASGAMDIGCYEAKSGFIVYVH